MTKKDLKTTEAALLTLRDMVSHTNLIGDVEIVNECNETLITISYPEDNVCPLTDTLSETLLNRAVLSFGTRDGRTLFKLEGVDDAD